MRFFDLINSRISVRNYDPDKTINKDTLMKIAEAGRVAPSAANRQPWKFIFISSNEMLNKVRKCYHRQWFKDAPHILVVVGNYEEAWVRQADGYNSLETDLTIAMDHMILAAESLGIGTCWIAAFDNEILRESLQLQKNEIVYSITPLGYPTDGYIKNTNKIRKSMDEVVQFI